MDIKKAEGNTEETAEIGDTITIKSENFYVYSNKDGYIKAIAKYNLYVGGEYNTSWTAYDTTVEGYGLQHRHNPKDSIYFLHHLHDLQEDD